MLIKPETIGVEALGEVSSPSGELYALPAANYGALCNSRRKKVQDDYYRLAPQQCQPTLSDDMAEMIINYDGYSPLSSLLPVVSDGSWTVTPDASPVLEAPDLSGFGPVCCDAGIGKSITAPGKRQVTYARASFGVPFETCLLDEWSASSTGALGQADQIMRSQLIEVIDYGSTMIALKGGFGIQGLIENSMIPTVYMPYSLSSHATTGEQVLGSIVSALSALSATDMPAGGYTLVLPSGVVRALMRPYGGDKVSSILSILKGACACPGAEGIGDMITSVVGIEQLHNLLPGVGSGNVGFIMPANDRRYAYWSRPVPYEFLEPERSGLRMVGMALCHLSGVHVLRPKHFVKLVNV